MRLVVEDHLAASDSACLISTAASMASAQCASIPTPASARAAMSHIPLLRNKTGGHWRRMASIWLERPRK